MKGTLLISQLITGPYWNIKWQHGRRIQDMFSCSWGVSAVESCHSGSKHSQFWHTDLLSVDVFSSASFISLTSLHAAVGVSVTWQWCLQAMGQGRLLSHHQSPSCVPLRVKAAQNELGQQILADFEEAFPSQGTKVKFSLSLFLPLKSVTENCSACLLFDLVSFFLSIWSLPVSAVPLESKGWFLIVPVRNVGGKCHPSPATLHTATAERAAASQGMPK